MSMVRKLPAIPLPGGSRSFFGSHWPSTCSVCFLRICCYPSNNFYDFEMYGVTKYGLMVGIALVAMSLSQAQGHGLLYGLQTPMLAKGGVDFNATAMSIATEQEQSWMLRYIWSYGLTEDIQLNITTPTLIHRLSDRPRTRGNSNMPANSDIEASVWYRLFSNAFGVRKRVESTAILGVSALTEEARGETNVGHAIHGAVSTGYASSIWYAWIGGGYQYYFEIDEEQLGDLPYARLVIGYRPNFFMGDNPKPDWRMFVESLAEFPG